MRIVIIGQQAFGAAALEAFLQRGDTVAGVFCAPEKPGARPDPLRLAAEQRGLTVFQFPSLRGPEAAAALRALDVDLGVMAYVLQFAPQDFVTTPRHGMIQYHPSLLPAYRGPSAISWPIIKGDKETGLTIFRPTDGLDEGPIILQKQVAIGPDDTLGKVYFERLFPLGVAALMEAADLVVAGRHEERVQDESQAGYEGWCRDAEAEVKWHGHLDAIYNLIRGCDPAPGAWSRIAGRKVRLFDVRRHPARRFQDVTGKPGTIAAIGAESLTVTVQGGQIEILKVKPEGVGKMAAAAFARELGLTAGQPLESATPAAAPARPARVLEPAEA